ncbi:MAG TPA: chemotaxis protein CheD [Polyangiaceae bacterium]|nr:chemotaxis protein CheD [Polyangiaceae bacterium]
MSVITVGVGDMQVSANPDAVLVTYALGSCIAVCVYDATKQAGGMIHYMLPNSAVSPERAQREPAVFADTGVPMLFERLYALGCKKPNLIVKVVGGANIRDPDCTFDIGQRNYLVLRKMFWKVNVPVKAEDVGGNATRTARLCLKTGTLTVRISDRGTEVEL